jgi:hypothetical protein
VSVSGFTARVRGCIRKYFVAESRARNAELRRTEAFDERSKGMTRKEFYTQAFLAALPAVAHKYERSLGSQGCGDSATQIAELSAEVADSALREWIKGVDEIAETWDL